MEEQPKAMAEIIPFPRRHEDLPAQLGRLMTAQMELADALLRYPAGVFGLLCYGHDRQFQSRPDADVIDLDEYRQPPDPA